MSWKPGPDGLILMDDARHGPSGLQPLQQGQAPGDEDKRPEGAAQGNTGRWRAGPGHGLPLLPVQVSVKCARTEGGRQVRVGDKAVGCPKLR